MQGSKTIHSISSLSRMDSKLLLIWQLICFCLTCVDGGEENYYDEIQHVEPWNTINFVLTECAIARKV